MGSENPFSAERGGMLSGWAASRIGQLLDTASQYTFGDWQGGHHPRWQNRGSISTSLRPPSRMVDPLSYRTIPPSPAEPNGHQNFAYHPATSARTRCIHRASADRTLPNTTNRLSKRADGYGGPPLRIILRPQTRSTRVPTNASRGVFIHHRTVCRKLTLWTEFQSIIPS